MSYSEILTKEFLQIEYLDKDKTVKVLSKELNISPNTIVFYITKYKLSKKPHSWSVLTKEYLEENYIRLNKTVEQICSELGIKSDTSVRDRLKQFNIRKKVPSMMDCISSTDIVRLYLEENMSLEEISNYAGRVNNWKMVDRALKLHNTPRRIKTRSKKTLDYYKQQSNMIGDICDRYWATVIKGAEKRNLEFNITKEYVWDLFLKQDKKCIFSGITLYFKPIGYKNIRGTASLDRIDSSKGYIEGNVQWIHKKFQLMKGNQYDEQFIIKCGEVWKHQQKLKKIKKKLAVK